MTPNTTAVFPSEAWQFILLAVNPGTTLCFTPHERNVGSCFIAAYN